MSKNVLILSSVNLGQQPEFYSDANITCLTLSVSEDTGYFDKEKNDWVERNEWHQAKVYGNYASELNGKFNKGDQFWLQGKLKYSRSEYQVVGKDGEIRTVTMKSAYLKIDDITRTRLGKVSQQLKEKQNPSNVPQTPQGQTPAMQQQQAG